MFSAFQKTTQGLVKGQTKSAVSNQFIYGILLFVIAVVSSYLRVDTWIVIVLVVLACLMFALGIGLTAYFAINNPTYLRSEKFQIRHAALELMGDNTNKNLEHLDKIMESPHAKSSISSKMIGETTK